MAAFDHNKNHQLSITREYYRILGDTMEYLGILGNTKEYQGTLENTREYQRILQSAKEYLGGAISAVVRAAPAVVSYSCSGLQSLSVGHCFNQSLENVVLPRAMQITRCGHG